VQRSSKIIVEKNLTSHTNLLANVGDANKMFILQSGS